MMLIAATTLKIARMHFLQDEENFASLKNHGMVVEIRSYFEENVTNVMKRDISPDTAQSEISKMNHLVLLAKETSLMVLLAVLKTKALRICLLIIKHYHFIHLMLLVTLIA